MKKLLTLLVLLMLCVSPAFCGDAMTDEQNDKMAWWRDAHFGMFIHWGTYAQWGGVYNGHLQRVGGTEWIMNRCKISVAEYQDTARVFNPVNFDADAVVKMAKDAGMKYLVFTTKHHDGFAMFRSDASSFNIVDFTQYKKDVVDALVNACKKYGIKFGIYYSQMQDWNNGGTTARRTMDQGWLNPDAAAIDEYTEAHNGSWDPAQQKRTYDEYFDQVAIPQLRELLTRHGRDISVIFWDTPSGMKPEYAAKVQALLEQYPHIITNDRLIRGKNTVTGDYKTPEQTIPTVKQLDGCDWETCMTISDSWGHKKRGAAWKSPRTLITNLIDITSKGGNFLLNVAPDETGAIPQENITRLNEVGKWMTKYGDAIYGTERMRIKQPNWGYCTQKITHDDKTKVYLFVTDWPDDGKLFLRLYHNATAVRLLDSGNAVEFDNTPEGIYLNLPKVAPDEIASVIELDFDHKLPREKRKSMNSKNFKIVDEPAGANAQNKMSDKPTFVHPTSDKYEYPTDPEVLAKLDKWQDRKLGIMFHWGIYSVPGIAESWALCSEDPRFTKRRLDARPDRPSYGDFKKWYWDLAKDFNPTGFEPSEWARMAKDNGFKYVIFTTKHHDGFCMFDTKQTDYKITNGPYADGKYANIAYHLFDAFRNEGLMIGAYFSKPDWHNENFWDPFFATPDRNPNYDTKRYPQKWQQFQNYTAAQIDELMTDYGPIDILWLDGGWVRKPDYDIDVDKIIDDARLKQPGLIAVDRTIPGRNENYQTPEQSIPAKQQTFPWESCLTLSNTWGWNPNPKYKSARWVINTLAEIVAKGGCLALNVGPDRYGKIDEAAQERLAVLGDWLKRNGEAIYSTRITPDYHSGNTWFTAAKDGKTLYAIYALPEGEALPATISWEGNVPKGHMTLLSTGKAVKYTVKDNVVTVTVPANLPDEPIAFKYVSSKY